MPGAPKGNKNAVGNKGGTGRKSYAQERADYESLLAIFNKNYTPEEIKELLEGNKSIRKTMIKLGLGGDSHIISKIMDKLFPDNANINLTGTVELKQIQADTQKLAKAIAQAMRRK